MLPYRLSICGLEEIAGFTLHRVSHAVSILDPEWPDPKDFQYFDGCRRDILRFHDVIDESAEVVAPMKADIVRILSIGETLRTDGARHLLVHCHAGISRSTATAAILLAQFQPGREEQVFDEIVRLRPRNWPNSRMVELADDLLGRDGALVSALRDHHAKMVRTWPDLAESIRAGARFREYELAEERERRRLGPRGDR